MAGIADFIRSVVVSHRCGESDTGLLTRFINDRDETAFTALIRRHGPMVYRVCWGVLRNEADAEDATQAAFLVLAQKANGVRNRDSLPSWLHGIALRTARKLRTSIARRRVGVAYLPPSASGDDLTVREASTLLHEELERLPAHYKAPLVLCYLQGRTHDEAALELGCTLPIFRGRLERARTRLRDRLDRRHLSLTAVLPAFVLIDPPSALATTFAAATSRAAAGSLEAATRGLVSPTISYLTQEILQNMAFNHLKFVGTLIAAMALTGGGFFAYRSYHPASEQSRGAESAPRKAGNPSGKMLVCQYNRFAVLKQDGSGLTPVGDELDEYEFIYRHRVSPDGKSVAFHHQTRVGMVLSLWKFDEPWPGQVLRTEQSHDFFWMPDGKHLVQCRYKSIEDNFPADFEFQTLDVATRKVASVPLPEGHWLSDISRDGKWFLTVKSDPKNVDTGGPLYRVDRATGKARMLFDKEMLVVPPLWWRISPDGTQVAGMKVYGARRLQLAVGDVAAGTFRQVTREDHHVSLFGGWSPDGKKLLYSFSDAPAKPKADEPYQDSFVTIDTDGGNRAELYRKKRHFNAQGQRQVMDSVGWADWR